MWGSVGEAGEVVVVLCFSFLHFVVLHLEV